MFSSKFDFSESTSKDISLLSVMRSLFWLVKGRPASNQNSKGVKIIQLLAMHHETTTTTYSYSSPWLHAAAEACKSLQFFSPNFAAVSLSFEAKLYLPNPS
jgi:hypothetical protein